MDAWHTVPHTHTTRQRLTPSALRSQTTTKKRFIFHKTPTLPLWGWPHVTSHEMAHSASEDREIVQINHVPVLFLLKGRVSCGKRPRQVLAALLLLLLLHAAAAAAAAAAATAAASGGARSDAARLDGRWGAASRTNAS